MLDGLFSDKDNLPSLLREVINSSFSPDGKNDIRKPGKLAKNLNNIWSESQQKEPGIKQALSEVKSSSIRDKLLNADDINLPGELGSYINGLLKDRIGIDQTQVMEALFEIPLGHIRREKEKFREMPSEDTVELAFRVVKGPGYGTWGLCAGVCIATDLKLWENENFSISS